MTTNPSYLTSHHFDGSRPVVVEPLRISSHQVRQLKRNNYPPTNPNVEPCDTIEHQLVKREFMSFNASTITAIASCIIAVSAVITIVFVIFGALSWLVDMRSDVDSLQRDVAEIRRDIDEARQERAAMRKELLDAIKQSEDRIIDALSDHTHNADGRALFQVPP